MPEAVRSFWAEPPAADPPARNWRDWVLVGVLVAAAVLEVILRDGVLWRPVALAEALGVACTLLWRRSRPLLMVAIGFGAVLTIQVASLVAGAGSVGLYATACILLLSYALLRWGSGREIVVGLPIILVVGIVGIAADYTGVADAVGASVFFLFPAVLGAAVRYRATTRLRETEQVKLREREQIARELHDTVAHHVSAIAVRAQAGRVVAAADPHAAVDALRIIEAEASQALSEMRLMVGALREGEQPDFAPQRVVADIARLAQSSGGPPVIRVDLIGDLENIRPSVGAAVYRLAQESITNAVRHARHPTHIDVVVNGDADCVRLTVGDDGEPHAGVRSWSGYGLVGMAERARLLGGTLEAGPGPDRGWTVTAVLPRSGSVG